MIEEFELDLIVNVFDKCEDLNEEEQKFYNKLIVLKERANLHKEFSEKVKAIQEKLEKVSEETK